MTEERKQRLIQLIDENPEALPQAIFFAKGMKDQLHQYALKLHVSDQELTEILDGKRTVKKVVYQAQGKRSHRLMRYGLEAVAVIILSLALSVSGLADSCLRAFLSILNGPISTSVAVVSYRSDTELSEQLLPTLLPPGYNYKTHTLSSGGTLFILYEDDAGNSIQYFCYPKNAVASYDNEFTIRSQFTFDRGTAYRQ